MKRAALVLAISCGCVSCGLFVAFDGFDTSPSEGVSAEAGAGGPETSTVGFHLESTPSTLVLPRDVPATVTVRAVRDPGFVEAITFDAPTFSSTAFTLSAAPGAPADAFSAEVLGTIAGPAGKITFSAHATGRSQSLDVSVSIAPSSGDPDPAFADGGVTVTEDCIPFGVVAEDSGRAIVAVTCTIPGGHEQILHAWSASGLRDTAFGDAGDTTLQTLGFDYSEGHDIEVSSSGIVVTTDDTIRRVAPNGKIDSSFGDSGVVGTVIHAAIVAIDGEATNALGANVPTMENFAQHLTSTGALDPSWGDAGTVDLGPTENGAFVPACARVVDGKLLVVTASRPAELLPKPEIFRLTSTGVLDPTWGVGGSHLLPLVPVTACAISANGTAVLATPGSLVQSNGTKDSTSAATFVDTVSEVAIDSMGRIIVAGSSGSTLAVARYLPDGTPDTAFHSGGLAFGVHLPYDGAVHVSLTVDDGVLVAASGGTPNVLFVTRLLP